MSRPSSVQRRNEYILSGIPQTSEQKRRWLWENCWWIICRSEFNGLWILWNGSWAVAVQRKLVDAAGTEKFATRRACVEYYFDRVPPKPYVVYHPHTQRPTGHHVDVRKWIHPSWKDAKLF